MGVPGSMMVPGMMYPTANNENWMNAYQMQAMAAQQVQNSNNGNK